MQILPALLLALLGGQQVLDDFRYDNVASARAAWTAEESTPPVEVVSQDKRPILRLSAPWAGNPTIDFLR